MSYIGQHLPPDVFGAYTVDTFTGDGSATTFTLSRAPASDSALIVVVDNVIQQPTTNFTVSGTTLTIVGTAILSGITGYAIHTQGKIPSSEVALNTINANTIAENTAGSGVTIDSLEIKDGKITNLMNATLSAADLGSGIHIKSADSSAATHTSVDELVLENNGHCGISILSATDATGNIYFNDSGGIARGYFEYNHDGDKLSIGTSGSTQMTIDSAGKTGVAESTLASQFHVSAPSGFSQYIVDFDNASSSAPYGLFINYSGAAPDSGSDYEFAKFVDTGATRFIIYSDGDVKNHDNSYGSISDERIKQNITDANSQWDDIKAIKVRNFKRKDDVRQYGEDKAKIQIGLIAQELESVSSNLVDEAKPSSSDILSSSEFGTLWTKDDSETQDAVLYTADSQEVIDGNKNVGDIKTPSTKQIGDVKEVKENVKGIKYSVLYMKAIKALQEAQTRIETLETKVAALEG